jgi:hypothetical protein
VRSYETWPNRGRDDAGCSSLDKVESESGGTRMGWDLSPGYAEGVFSRLYATRGRFVRRLKWCRNRYSLRITRSNAHEAERHTP